MSKRLRGFLQYSAIVLLSGVLAIVLAEAYLASRATPPGALPFYGQLYPYVMFRPQANLRYVSSETFEMSHHAEQVHHYTNDDGLRVSAPDYELPKQKPPGQLRLAVLGGSAVEIATTFETTLPGSLKTLLQKAYPGRDIEVINAGIQSSVSRQSIIHLMFTVADYEPDIVVLYDGHNDIGMPLMYDARPNFPYNFHVMQEAWDSYRERHQDSLFRIVLDRSHLYAALSARWGDDGDEATARSTEAKGLLRAPHALTPAQIRDDPDYARRFVAEYLTNWEKLIDLSKTYDFEPVFVLQPTGAFDREYTIAALRSGFNIEEPAAVEWLDAFNDLYRETGPSATHATSLSSNPTSGAKRPVPIFSLLLPAAVLCLASCGAPADSNFIRTEDDLRRTIAKGTGEIQLAAGVIEVSSPIEVPEGIRDLDVIGHPSGTTLRVSPAFTGRAVLVFRSAENVKLSGFSIEGHRKAVNERVGIPPDNETFTSFYTNNGIIFEDVRGLHIATIRFSEIWAFPIIVNQGQDVRIEDVHIRNSGSLNEKGRNNTSGGILLEEGTADFVVRNCTFENVRGNGIWTHSRYESPRNRDGLIEGNRFRYIARDAIQVGHATRIRVEGNHGERIGYPFHYADVEGRGYPVGIDTAGNTDESIYANNTFDEINGKCIDLDGFHHGEVRGNRCTNKGTAIDYPLGHFAIIMNNTNPDMNSEQIVVEDNEVDGAVYGGLFIIGSGHRVVNNRFRNLNRVQCVEGSADLRCHFWLEEPALLRTGIYLGRQAERPAVTRDNVIEGNVVTGFGMTESCIAAAPGVRLAANRIIGNECRDQ